MDNFIKNKVSQSVCRKQRNCFFFYSTHSYLLLKPRTYIARSETVAIVADLDDSVVMHTVLQIDCILVFSWVPWTFHSNLLTLQPILPLLTSLNSFSICQSFNSWSSINPFLPGTVIFPPFSSFSEAFFHFLDMAPSLLSQGCYGDVSFLYTGSFFQFFLFPFCFFFVFCFWLAAFLCIRCSYCFASQGWGVSGCVCLLGFFCTERTGGWVWLVVGRTGILLCSLNTPITCLVYSPSSFFTCHFILAFSLLTCPPLPHFCPIFLVSTSALRFLPPT